MDFINGKAAVCFRRSFGIVVQVNARISTQALATEQRPRYPLGG
jgi:hypothetical protein